jgi:NAD+ diphosphatase
VSEAAGPQAAGQGRVARDAAADDAAGGWELTGLALARGTVDRATIRRNNPDWVRAAWADPAARVLVLAGGRAPVRVTGGGASLVLVPPEDAPAGTRFLLGVDEAGTAYFGVAAASGNGEEPAAGGAGAAAHSAGAPAGTAQVPVARQPGPPAGGRACGGGVRMAGLREAGPLLGDRDAGLLTHAVALANWHEAHPHCPRCGALTEPLPAGHARVCPADGSEHFPRTDPAVIMLVTDEDGRCLLARNQRWPARRVSILAGFVEPGESAEQAVVREVAEETGIAVSGVRYLGSQPWPMPQSLMLGFRAEAASGQQFRVDPEEIAEAHWYSRDDVRSAVAEGALLLPPPVSIAHRIIEAWYGQPLPSPRFP